MGELRDGGCAGTGDVGDGRLATKGAAGERCREHTTMQETRLNNFEDVLQGSLIDVLCRRKSSNCNQQAQ